MSTVALVLMALYLALTFGVRIAIQLRRTGSSGLSSLRNAPAIELIGGTLFFTAVVLGALNPPLAIEDAVDVYTSLDRTWAHIAGLILCGIGIVGTFAAQMAMGASWRIGVDPGETTDLVTGGVFALCRNPIYSFMVIAWAGFGLLVPTWLMALAGVLLITGLEIQVRKVEEPHLIRTHGEPYRAWARQVGRFVPGLGRLS